MSIALAAALLAVGLLPASAGAVTASPESLGGLVVDWVNRERVERGLVPLRADPALASLAADRAANMAAAGTMSHAAAGGSVGTSLTSRGIQWWGFGEVIGASTYAWGRDAAANVFRLWMASDYHRPLLMSRDYNYLGAGFAYRSSTNTTYASIVLTESRDHTRPVARMRSGSVSGRTISFSWKGHDRRLQTHTAGLRGFDVQVRKDDGAWRTIRDDTERTSITLRDRRRGHSYSLRVRAVDRRGNLGAWTKAITVWVR